MLSPPPPKGYRGWTAASMSPTNHHHHHHHHHHQFVEDSAALLKAREETRLAADAYYAEKDRRISGEHNVAALVASLNMTTHEHSIALRAADSRVRLLLSTLCESMGRQMDEQRQRFETRLARIDTAVDRLRSHTLALTQKRADDARIVAAVKVASDGETDRADIMLEPSAQRNNVADNGINSTEQLSRALGRIAQLVQLCESLTSAVEEKDAALRHVSEVNLILAKQVKAAAADSEARVMEAEARTLLTQQNHDMEKQLRELRGVVQSLLERHK